MSAPVAAAGGGSVEQTLRLFVAIDLPGPLKDNLRDLQGRLCSALGPAARAARWVDPAGTHLTLAFLGNVDAGRVGEIDAALRAPAAASPPFELRTAALGAFPNARRPRQLWLGVEGDLHQLGELQDRVVGALEPLGFPRERRPFS